MSGFFPTSSGRQGAVHTSPPGSPSQGGSNRTLKDRRSDLSSSRTMQGSARAGTRRADESERGRDEVRSRRGNDESYYDRRPTSRRDTEEPGLARAHSSRYDQEEDFLFGDSPGWARKSSRQRRFTQTSLPRLHAREQIALGEIDYDQTEREQVLDDMNERMNDMSGYITSVVQRKEEDLKFMEGMFDDEGNPLQRYDEDGNPIPFRDEDGHEMAYEEDSRKPKSVSIETTKMSMKEGWLWKKGSGQGYSGRRNWVRRYFKFDMFQVVNIYYFAKEMPPVSEQHQTETKEAYTKRKKAFFNQQKNYARGYVKLMYASLEIPDRRRHRNPVINPEWVFQVVIPNARIFTLCAESQEDYDRWTQTIGYITTTIQKARESLIENRPLGSVFNEAKRDAALCCAAYGKGLFEAVAGHPSEFYIQGFDFDAGIPATFGGQKLTAVLESRDLHYDLPVKDNGDGTYTVSYTPTRVGTYELSVMLEDYDVKGSPFHPLVRPAPVSAPHCVADGAGLFCAVVGAVNRFNIHTRNAFNQIVVAKGVPFEVMVSPPLILCHIDGSTLASPSDWRPHDNGNGTYAVAYLVEPTPELLDRLNRGDHFEGEISVQLNDHIYTPSFSRNIKNAPFHPVLAASATGAALASAARHAALLLGGSDYTDFINSFHQQQAQPPRLSDLNMATASTTIPRRDSSTDEVESSFYVKETPVASRPQQEKRRYDDFASEHSSSSSYAVRPNEYLPVRQHPSSSRNVNMSPDQRDGLDAEREQLLRLRRELMEGKHLVDEQVGRIAYVERKAQDEMEQRSRSGVRTDEDSPIPPLPYQYARTRPAATKAASMQPPQRSPPQVAASSPATPSFRQFDASVQALFSKHASALKRVYRHYMSRDSVSGVDLVHVSAFIKCLTDFDVTPTFASRKEVRDAFAKAAGGTDGVDFPSFVEALGHVAISALSKPTFANLYPTPASKVQVLLTMWGLGEAGTFEDVLHKERYSRGL